MSPRHRWYCFCSDPSHQHHSPNCSSITLCCWGWNCNTQFHLRLYSIPSVCMQSSRPCRERSTNINTCEKIYLWTYANSYRECGQPIRRVIFRILKSFQLFFQVSVAHRLECGHANEEPDIEAGKERAENPATLTQLLLSSQGHYCDCNILKINKIFISI